MLKKIVMMKNYIIEQLEHFFRIINPFSVNKQGNDVGTQYRSGIYLDDLNDKESVLNYMKSYFGDNFDKVKIKENVDYDLAEQNHQKILKEKSIWILSCESRFS